ncbi:FBP domain-containing protein [Paenibacillus sp. TRM 82003]|uniref:FBP domain-containing protein n=1 Tax=Kineococcus sp. TRM81007 TaxID=2925831 RepID=UPI001F5934C0|nr:FBP domain-containing protein [Kineococcus sp. TRM81007]MCI2238741.1 FBP domain-containing protein [Kineococcus sp. TRM81007]MCI3924148.1 FBP domain-containing protein [Paenibacillus sp. TRM 82003]
MTDEVTGVGVRPLVLTDDVVRRALRNCSKGEASRLNVPAWVRETDTATAPVVGWRDPKAPERGCLLVLARGEARGLLLRAPSSGGARAAAMCDLCRTTRSAGDVALFAAPRAGAAGRRGDTVGVYACADLACARCVEVEKGTSAVRPDPGRTVEERRADLARRAGAFVDSVLGA